MSNKSFKQDCEFIATQRIPRLASITLIFVTTLVIVMISYSFLIEVDVKTSATGVFEFSSKNKHFVEAPAPGIVDKVLVSSGELVKKGQTIMIMTNAALLESYSEEILKLKSQELTLVRLEAEKEDKNPVFKASDRTDHPEMVENEIHHYEMDMNHFAEEKRELEQAYRIADKEYQLMLPLLEGGHIAKFDMEKQKRKVDSAKSDLDLFLKNRINDLAKEIKETHHKIEGQEKKVARLKEQVDGLEVISPQDGIVASRSITTRGANVKKSDRVAELIDPGSEMVVNLTVSPDSIGFIKVGQQANVKIDSYDFSVYGNLDGTVSSISYTPVIKNATTVYEVTVKTKTQYLDYKGAKMDIIPGMTCVADILTNKVSLITYLLKPVVKNYTEGDL